MSSWDLGSVRSEIDGEYTDLIVGQGSLEYHDKNDELHMMHLTTPQLEALIKILIPAYFSAQEMDLEDEEGGAE